MHYRLQAVKCDQNSYCCLQIQELRVYNSHVFKLANIILLMLVLS